MATLKTDEVTIEKLICGHVLPSEVTSLAMAIDGNEALANTLIWVAEQLRAGVVSGVSLEVSNGRGRLSVEFAVPGESAPAVVKATVELDDD